MRPWSLHMRLQNWQILICRHILTKSSQNRIMNWRSIQQQNNMVNNFMQGEKRGLLFCELQFVNSAYCWFKASEMLISGIFVALCIYQLYKQLKVYGAKFQWRFFAIVFMMASLLVNMAFCLWNYVYELYSIESYFYSLYYLTIVGYVCRLYIRKNAWDQKPYCTYIFAAAIISMGCLYTAILIDSIVDEKSQAMVNQSCEQVWYLCVNVICLTSCLVALLILFVNYREETERMLLMSYAEAQVNNPLGELWCWIGINTLAQIVDLVETGLLSSTDTQSNCMIIRNSEIGNTILLFFFAIFSLTAGFAATLYYFSRVRRSIKVAEQLRFHNSLDISQDLRGSYGVQMFHTFLQGLSG